MSEFVTGKMVNIKGNWQRVFLTKDEIDKAMDELVKFNLNEMERILKVVDASEMDKEISKIELINMLFERQGVASFTVLGNALDEKIHKLKSESWKPEPPKKFEPKKVVIEEKEEEPENPMEAGELEGDKDEYEEVTLPKDAKRRKFF
jgi:hypothetical protein